jgi:dolichol kinase
MSSGYFITGLLFGIVLSLFLYGVPVSDGYDGLALLAGMSAAFDFGINFLDRRIKDKITAGFFLMIIGVCAFLSFSFSPYFLAGGFLFLMITMLIGWHRDDKKTGSHKFYAIFSGFSLVITLFISFYYV